MKTLDMTKGKPITLLLTFALPLLIGTMFQQVYNLVDTMIVGYGLNENAVGAIGATASLYSVIVNFAIGMNNGFGVMIARLFGAGEIKRLRKAFAQMVILDLIVTVVLTGVMLPLLKPILLWLQTPDALFADAYRYISVIIGGMVATIAYNLCAGFLRSIGNSRTPLYFLMMSCVLNVIMDSLFVFVFHWGVVGAAVATLIAQAVSAITCMVYIVKHYAVYLPEANEWHLDKSLSLEMLTTGLSMGLMISVNSIGSIVLQKGVNMLGTTIVTAHTVSRRLFEFMSMPLATLGQACATFVGQNYGAGAYQRIKQGVRSTIALQIIWSLITICIANFAGQTLIHLLIGTTDTEIIKNAYLYLRVATLFFIPLGALVALRYAMQPIGEKIAPVISSIVELVAKLIFSIFLIPKWGYMGVIVTEPTIWVICCVYLLIVFIRRERQLLQD